MNDWSTPVLEELLRADRLSQVIDHTTAPAFLLGAVAGFLAIMLARVENLTQRIDDGKAASPSAEEDYTNYPPAEGEYPAADGAYQASGY